MASVKQVILLRTDLNLPKGLSEAQVAHLHFEQMRKTILDNTARNQVILTFSQDQMDWLKSPYIFVHGVPNIEVLEYFKKIAIEKNLLPTEWRDTIFIKASEKQTIALENVLIGFSLLGESDKIKAVIGDLPLLS